MCEAEEYSRLGVRAMLRFGGGDRHNTRIRYR